MPRLLSIRRGGSYFRLFKPGWADPLDAAYSKARGGRWTPPGEFGAVYLNQSIEVAAANARAQHAGRAIGLFDLSPSRRPSLLNVDVVPSSVVDIVSPRGIDRAGFPVEYPFGVSHASCWPVARRAYGEVGIAGIACRSNAESTAEYAVGEELAWFDRAPMLAVGRRRTFAEWYPGPHPT